MSNQQISGIRVHNYQDIIERNRGIVNFPSDLHLMKSADLNGTDFTAHIGDRFLFSYWYSSQQHLARIDWVPNRSLTKEEICKRMIRNYSSWLISIIQGSPEIEIDIQRKYKTPGKTVHIPAVDAEKHLPILFENHGFNNFQGLVLWGYKHQGSYACIGLDTIYFKEPWNTERGMIFVEYWTPQMSEKIARLYVDTAPELNGILSKNLARLLTTSLDENS